MAKKAWNSTRTRILEELVAIARTHETVSDIDRRDYKEDYFRVFKSAFQEGFCVPSYVEDHSRERLVRAKSQRELIHGDTIRELSRNADLPSASAFHLERLADWWDEWVFAWLHERPKRKYRRRSSKDGEHH